VRRIWLARKLQLAIVARPPTAEAVIPPEMTARLVTGGRYLNRVRGSLHILKHPTKPGTVTVKHPAEDPHVGALRSMERQSGVSLREG
jgi:predicted RNA binding protein YcfA (HicA-like mRNA interferase family)